MISHLSFSGKSTHVFRTLCFILADLNNALFFMFSSCPLISKFPCPCTTEHTNELVQSYGTVESADYISAKCKSFLNVSPRQVPKVSDGEASIQEIRGTLRTPLLLLLPALLWSRVVERDRVPCMGEIELIIFWTWKYLTWQKQWLENWIISIPLQCLEILSYSEQMNNLE